MADAELEYEKLKEKLLKQDDVTASQMFGKTCLKVHGKAFLALHQERIVFKLTGEEHRKAMAQPGAVLWDPSGKGRPMKEWVALTLSAKKHFGSLAEASVEYLRSLA